MFLLPRRRLLPLFIPLLGASLFAGLVFGAEKIPISALFDFRTRDPFYSILLFEIRLPRCLLALCTGALLAGAGAVFQGFFRNGLADPGILGVSSGATFGAVLASALFPSLPFIAGGMLNPAVISAFCGALFVVAASWIAAGKSRGGAGLLLAGAAFSSFFSALTSIVLLLRDRELYKIYVWTLGSFNGRGWSYVLQLAIPGVVAAALFFACARPLDLLSLGEQGASALGLNVKKWRKIIVCAASLGTAAAVCGSGTIGFIGLIAPHIARSLFGPEHRVLVGSSMCVGASLLLISDIIARTAAAPAEIPVGIITALMGTPFFLYILFKGDFRSE